MNLENSNLVAGGVVGAGLLLIGKKIFSGGVCKVKRDLTGSIAIITGGNTGIGKETCIELARLGATVIMASRDSNKSLKALEDIKNLSGSNKVQFMRLDLGNLKSIREFVENFNKNYEKLDILINNAGIMMLPEREVTSDGFEAQFGTNHLGHFYLTTLLVDKLKKAKNSRVINVSSLAHTFGRVIWDDINLEKNYGPMKSYSQSKIANVLFTKELQRRYGDYFKSFALHPGTVRTELTRYYVDNPVKKSLYFLATPFLWYFMKSPLEGAQTSLYCALADFDDLNGGAYFQDCKEVKPSKEAANIDNAKKLWDISEKMIQEKLNTLKK